MNRWLKGFLRVVSTIFLVAGPAVAALMMLAALFSVGTGDHVARGLVPIATGVYVLVVCLLTGGVIKLLLSIDDRLERLELQDGPAAPHNQQRTR